MYALTHKLVHYLQGGPASSGLAREEDGDEGEATPTADGSTEGPARAELVTQSATTPILNDGEPAAPDKDDEDGSEDGCVEGDEEVEILRSAPDSQDVAQQGADAETIALSVATPLTGCGPQVELPMTMTPLEMTGFSEQGSRRPSPSPCTTSQKGSRSFSALADPVVGAGLAVAIGVHNIEEGSS